MIRRVIKIDGEKCNGCGLCADACHEGAIIMVNGKAKLLRDDYCDGLGDCLPSCAAGAITFEEREAVPYDEEAVKAHMEKKKAAQIKVQPSEKIHFGCPGAQTKILNNNRIKVEDNSNTNEVPSQLNQWPVQIKLVSPNARFFDNAKLLIAADCTAYSYGNFHNEFMKNKVTLIGCPKLDAVDYSEKLTTILKENDIQSITVTRMEVPCCGGIVNAVQNALKESGKIIPCQIVTISTGGEILGM